MIAANDVKTILNETSVFAGLPSATLERIAQIVRIQTYEPGTFIYRHGDDALEACVLVKGLVRFTIGKGSGALFPSSLIRSRTIFGWAALVPEHPRRLGSAECLERSTLILIGGDQLLEILRDDPSAGFLVMQRLASMIARNFMTYAE